jgi:hypothetical protein
MTDFRNPRNNGQILTPIFWWIYFEGKGSSGGTAVNLSAEVSGRTKTGVTGKASINASGNRKINQVLAEEGL